MASPETGYPWLSRCEPPGLKHALGLSPWPTDSLASASLVERTVFLAHPGSHVAALAQPLQRTVLTV